MSIASELQNYADGLDDAWDAAEDMGATIPHDRNMNNLDDAIRTIPVSSPNDGVLTITKNGVTIQTFSADQATNVTAALTDTTYSNFVGATSSVAGTAGLVPAPAAGDDVKYLKGDGTWDSDVVYGYTDSLILSNAGHIWKDTSFTETFKASEIQGIVLAGKKFILVKRVSGTTTSVSQITGFSIGQIDPNDYGEIMFFMDGMPCTCIASTNNETWSLV